MGNNNNKKKMLFQTKEVRNGKRAMIPVNRCDENDKSNPNKDIKGNIINIKAEDIHVHLGPGNYEIFNMDKLNIGKLDTGNTSRVSVLCSDEVDRQEHYSSSLNKVAEQINNTEEDLSKNDIASENIKVDVANENIEKCDEKINNDEKIYTSKEILSISSEDAISDCSNDDDNDIDEYSSSMFADIEEESSDLLDEEEDHITCFPESENIQNSMHAFQKLELPFKVSNSADSSIEENILKSEKEKDDELSPPTKIEGENSSLTSQKMFTYKIGLVKDTDGNIENITEVKVPGHVVNVNQYIQRYLHESGIVPKHKSVTGLTKKQRDDLKQRGKLPE